jgi:hypothetical protein
MLVLVIVGLGIAGGAGSAADRQEAGVHVEHFEMLEPDQAMLQRMRSGTSQVMMTMIQEDPTWVDPDMIRLQEEYQAQLDRMIGRRPDQA